MFKLLGVWQQDNPCWNYHVEQTLKKASKRLYFLMECRKANLPTEIGITIYCTKICPLLEYASPVSIEEIGSLGIDDANGSENVGFKMNSRFFNRFRVYSLLLKMASVSEFSWS